MPNQGVLEQAKQTPHTHQILKQQLLLYGKVARAPDDDPLRILTFCPGSLRPAASRYVRRVGRPKSEWATKLYDHALRMTGGIQRLDATIRCTTAWTHHVLDYCKV